VTGIEPACPAWEVQNRQCADLVKSEKYLFKCRVDHPALPAHIRRSPWRGARLGHELGVQFFWLDSRSPPGPWFLLSVASVFGSPGRAAVGGAAVSARRATNMGGHTTS